MDRYEFTTEMGEISGFGGGYEQACRDMVIAGLKWLDEHPKTNLNYKTFKNVYGLTTNESKDVQAMQKEMLKAANDDCTGAMMQATLSHIMFIRKEGWDKYVKEMSKPEDNNAKR